jgi:hypothetical protein
MSSASDDDPGIEFVANTIEAAAKPKTPNHVIAELSRCVANKGRRKRP